MNYVVKCDNQLLYKKYAEGYDLVETDFDQVDNEPGNFTFSFLDTHPLYNSIVPKKSKIKIYKDGQLVWLGRVTEQKDDIDGQRTVRSVGCLSFLKDSIMRPFDFTGSPEELFRSVLQQHNDQVSEDQKLFIGNCTVTDPNDTIVRSSIYYLSTYTIFKEKLLNLGGHLVVTFGDDERPVLNWYAEITNYTTQQIKFGENLADYEKSLLYDDFYTACIPLGAKDEDNIRLTISSVNSGNDFILNSGLSDLYGIFYAPTNETTWDDVTVAANLLVKGTSWLSNVGIKYKEKIELDAEDISFLPDVNVTDFYFQKNVQFVTASGTIVPYFIADFDVDILDPYSVSIVLSSEESVYMKGSFTDVTNRVNEASAEQIRNVESQSVSTASAESLVNTLIQQSTYITQTANEIVLAALREYSQTSDLANLVNTLSTQLTVLSEGVNIDFSRIEQLIANQGTLIDSQGQIVESTFQIYNSWFRFIPQSSTQNAGLVIGQSGNPVQVKLESDVMYFCTDPDNAAATSIAYFSSGQLHVNFANVQNLTIGIPGRWFDVRIVGSGDNVCALFSGRLS
jgi:hypothetical protein